MVEGGEAKIVPGLAEGLSLSQRINWLVNPPDDGSRGPLVVDPHLVGYLKRVDMMAPQAPSKAFWEGALNGLWGIAEKVPFDDGELNDQLSWVAALVNEQVILGGMQEQVAVSGMMREATSRDISTYDIFVSGEFQQQPLQVQWDTFPPNWFRELDEGGQRLARVRARLSNAAFVKAQVADIDGQRAKENQFLQLTEREFKLLYEMPGVRECLEWYVQEMFEPNHENGSFFWRVKKGDNGKIDPNLRDQLMNIQVLQEEFMGQLLEQGVVEDQVDARAAVGAAWNFLYISNVVESADVDREVNPAGVYGEQIRAFCHPKAKAEAKYKLGARLEGKSLSVGTEEGWGGPVGAWVAERVIKDPEFRGKMKRGEIRPFPERLFLSLPEMIAVKAENSEGRIVKTTMAQALSTGWKMNIGVTESGFFGMYGDVWDSAWKVYNFVTGRVPVDYPKNIGNWAVTLADATAKLWGMGWNDLGFVDGNKWESRPLRKHVRDRELVLWAICSSLGLWHGTSDLVLQGVPQNGYDIAVRAIVDMPRLVDSRDDRNWIKNRLNAKGALASSLKRQKIALERSLGQGQ